MHSSRREYKPNIVVISHISCTSLFAATLYHWTINRPLTYRIGYQFWWLQQGARLQQNSGPGSSQWRLSTHSRFEASLYHACYWAVELRVKTQMIHTDSMSVVQIAHWIIPNDQSNIVTDIVLYFWTFFSTIHMVGITRTEFLASIILLFSGTDVHFSFYTILN